MVKASKRMKLVITAVAAAVLFGAWLVRAQDSGDALLKGFQDPPASAHPRVWWHWMNGNITKDGITADLEWMKRAGVAGFQNFDAGLETPQIVAKRLIFMTPEWKDAFRHAAATADRLGLEMAIAGSPGWSESGGPWVPPAQAMKKYVWTETVLKGGRHFSGVLAQPPSAAGPYLNLKRGEGKPEFYKDSFVVAFRLPDGARTMAELKPAVTASSGAAFALAALTDGDLVQGTLLAAAPAGGSAWLRFEFGAPVKIYGLSLTAPATRRDVIAGRELQASDDGVSFRTVAPVPDGARTIAFAPVTARFFRVAFISPAKLAPADDDGSFEAAKPAGVSVAELVLHTSPMVNRFEDKAAFTAAEGLYDMATAPVPAAEAIRKADVVDLTSRMKADGRLDWMPPAGRWVVLRFGYSLTGAQNSPASPEATGLEVDKMNRAYVKAYFDNYLDQYKKTVGPLMGKHGLQYVITDSWEAGVANWTDLLPAEFARRRGYDLRPWLPVLAGRVVGSAEASDRFLWDFRKTLGELTAENHYDQLTDILHARNMGRYTESHESGRAFIADGMDVKRLADIPMSAMWVAEPGKPNQGGEGDIRESASVAHLYGQNLVAAESLTAYRHAWAYSPETLKSTADRLMANGLNRFVIHTSVHQPDNEHIPGLGLGPFGQWFNRHETWAEIAKPWTDYLSRSCFMLQQGRFAADILYYYGEDSNITALFLDRLPDLPAGYAFDFVNASTILDRLAVDADGRITTATGMSYRVLVLDKNSRHMSLAVLRKLRDLVNAGATVVGPKPVDSPSLADDQAEFKALADSLWSGKGTGKGKGAVYGDRSAGEVLAALGEAPDFDYTRPMADTRLVFVHRRLADGDVYWVSNTNARPEMVEAAFRVEGRAPELWRAESGTVEPVSYRMDGGRTIVPLSLEPNDAVFVVFRGATGAGESRVLPLKSETCLAAVSGGWDVAFQAGRGAPASVRIEALGSWSASADPGVKYFSGTAVYTRTLEAPAEWFRRGARLVLDLGDVKNLAQVAVNGKPLGIYWKAPFRVDVTGALKPGANSVEIKVTNLWVNRIIGDHQPGVTKKFTYTAVEFYDAASPLLPSGLIGPVRVLRVE